MINTASLHSHPLLLLVYACVLWISSRFTLTKLSGVWTVNVVCVLQVPQMARHSNPNLAPSAALQTRNRSVPRRNGLLNCSDRSLPWGC